MLVEKLKTIKKIKEVKKCYQQYRYGVYQSRLASLEAEIVLTQEKISEEVALRKEYEKNCYQSLNTVNANMGQLQHIRESVKHMQATQVHSEKYLQSLGGILSVNKDALEEAREQLALVERSLNKIKQTNRENRVVIERKEANEDQEDNDDLAVSQYIKNL